MKPRTLIYILVTSLIILVLVPQTSLAQTPPNCGLNVPTPVLTFVGTEDYTANGIDWTRYRLSVSNWQDFPAELFTLGYTCGLNNNASRTWVDIYSYGGPDGLNTRIYGFCALPSPWWLTQIWFAEPRGTSPPANVYIELTDRACPNNPPITSNLLQIQIPVGYSPIALPLDPNGGTNEYRFYTDVQNYFNYKVIYPALVDPTTPVDLVVTPILISQNDLDNLLAGHFSGATLVPYDGTGGFGVLFRAVCQDPSSGEPAACPETSGPYDVKTSWNSPPGQFITAPAFLKADVGGTNWENIFTAFSQDRTDPTGSGRTCCRYSDFVFVQDVSLASGMQAPTIDIATPQDGAGYTLNQTVSAAYFCIDPSSVISSCLGTVPSGSRIDTSSPGSRSFEVNATVTEGPSADKTVNYQVGVYDTDSCQLYRQDRYVKQGATFPIKLQICDANGQNLSSPNITLHVLGVTKISSFVPITPLNTSGNVNPSRDFRFDSSLGIGGGYIVNVNTKGLSSGTWQLNFSIAGDPVTHSARFGVRK